MNTTLTACAADLKHPTVHLNGTSREALLDSYEQAGRAIDAALLALSDASPNARDYYPQGDGAFQTAVAQHRARYDALWAVKLEIEALAENLAEEAP